jgi:hypothetical protein
MRFAVLAQLYREKIRDTEPSIITSTLEYECGNTNAKLRGRLSAIGSQLCRVFCNFWALVICNSNDYPRH